MRYWCAMAPVYDRQWHHVFLADPSDPPSLEVLESMKVDHRPSPADIVDDETFYAAGGLDDPDVVQDAEVGGRRRPAVRGRGRGRAAAKGSAAAGEGRGRGRSRGRGGRARGSAAASEVSEAKGVHDEDRRASIFSK